MVGDRGKGKPPDSGEESSSRLKSSEKVLDFTRIEREGSNRSKLEYERVNEEFNDTLAKIEASALLETLSEKFKEALNSLSKELEASYQLIQGEIIAEEDGKKFNDLTKRILDMHEDLNRWYHIQEDSENFKKSLCYVPDKYRLLAKNLNREEITQAKEKYEEVLNGYNQGIDQLDARKCFEDICDSLHARPDALVKTFDEQIKLIDDKIRKLTGLAEGILHYMNLANKWEQYQQEWEQYQIEREKPDEIPTRQPYQWLQRFENHLEDFYDQAKVNQDMLLRDQRQTFRLAYRKEEREKCVRYHEFINACIGGKDLSIARNERLESYINRKDYLRGEQLLLPEIEPKKVDLSRGTKFVDVLLGRDPRKHRPGRVDKATRIFNENLREISSNLASDFVPKQLEDDLVKAVTSLSHAFCQSRDQTLAGYGEDGGRGRQSRQEAEKRIKSFQEVIQNLNKYLMKYKEARKFQDRIKTVPASTSNDDLPQTEQLVAKELLSDFDQSYQEVINYCQKLSSMPSIKKDLTDAYKRLEKAYNRVLILRQCSEMWRQMQGDIESINSIKNISRDSYKKLLDSYKKDDIEGTRNKEAYNQISTLYKALDILKAIYCIKEETTSWSWEHIENIKTLYEKSADEAINSFDKLLNLFEGEEAKHIEKAYQNFKSAHSQLSDRYEVLWVCKRIHTINEECIEEISKSNESEGNKLKNIKKDFEQLIASSGQENNWEYFKQKVLKEYKQIQDLINDKWRKHGRFYANLRRVQIFYKNRQNPCFPIKRQDQEFFRKYQASFQSYKTSIKPLESKYRPKESEICDLIKCLNDIEIMDLQFELSFQRSDTSPPGNSSSHCDNCRARSANSLFAQAQAC